MFPAVGFNQLCGSEFVCLVSRILRIDQSSNIGRPPVIAAVTYYSFWSDRIVDCHYLADS